MSILFGTARNQYPDFFAGTSTSADQLFNVAQDTLGKVLSIAGTRIFNGSFVEDGVQSVNGSAFIGSRFNDLVEPSRRQFLTQAPQATIFIKKRMFSTLRSNYDVRFLDPDERLMIRAIKNLFRRKCEEIAFYENLINIKKIISDPSFLTVDGVIGDLMLSLGLAASTGEVLGGAIDALIGSLGTVFPWFADIQRLQKTNERAKQNRYTTWVIDHDQPNFSGTGPGVGVIEFTMATSVDTTVAITSEGGSCTFTFEDPYQLTLITEADVDYALRQARSEEGGMGGFLDVTAQNNLRTASELDQELNQRLRSRGASGVNFEFPLGPNSSPVGSIIETNQIFTSDNVSSFDFDTFEQATILQILDLLSSYKTIQDRTSGTLVESSAQATLVRQKLRAEFVGHHIFQQMDAIHVFINSFTRNETPIYANRADLLLGNVIESIVSPEEQSGRISEEGLEQERQVLAPNTPLFVYKLLRNPAEWRSTGPQVFSGVITTINPTYSQGKFSASVIAASNMEFLKLSQINTTPSLEQPEGTLMDPLTPFDLVTEESSGLVIDKKLSKINQDRLKFLKFDNGMPITSEDALQNNISKTGAIITYQHVPGIVYKWKTGIVSASVNVDIAKPLSRSGITHTLEDVSENFGVHPVQGAFSNLDAADILGILITGQPYNYNNFIRNATDAGTFTVDNDTNNRSYFNTLFDYLDRQQSVWGGFVPAKSSVIDPEKTADLFRRQRDLTRTITKITDFRRDLAKVQDSLRKGVPISGPGPTLTSEADRLTKAIETQLAQLDASDLGTASSPFKLYGNAVQIQFTPEDIREMSNRLKYTVKKKPEDVRYNQDKNYFIVSERYDTDLDIQAFTLQLKGLSPDLFKSEWKKPFGICDDVAKMLDFEFFADSQGNLVFRPPEYNKTPLSLLLRMVQLGKADGISLAPPFLLQLLSSRIDLIKDKLLTIELEILEKGLMLGLDMSAIQQQFGVTLALKEFSTATTLQGLAFAFTTDTLNSPPRSGFSLDEEAIILEGNRSKAFTEDQQQKLIFKQDSTSDIIFNNVSPGITNTSAQSIDKIIDVRNQLSGLKGSTNDRLTKDTDTETKIGLELKKLDPGFVGSVTNRLNLSNTIAQLVSQRQTLIPIFFKLATQASQINASEEGLNLNFVNIIPEALGSLIDGAPPDKPTLPKFLEDMIENDLANFDGFNSGKRFIINDDVIISMNLTIIAPKFTRVNVTGNQNLANFSGILGENIGEGANVFWAGATDFDMWRQYGYRETLGVNRTFLQDPETQCAPYAVFQLVRQRRYIHSGSITVIGNEHYQAGEVVYVNCRQLMYYIESVHHNYIISQGTFTTTLQLSYGRPLGEYIPTPLDMIGKGLLANARRPFSAVKTVRTLVPNGNIVNLETLIIPSTTFFSSPGEFERINGARIKNAVQRAVGKITSTNKDLFSIEIRTYSASALTQDFSGAHHSASTYANEVKRLMTRGETPASVSSLGSISANGSLSLGDAISPSPILDSGRIITADKIKVCSNIDISAPLKGEDLRMRRMPSEQAWANAMEGGTSANGILLPLNSIDIVMVIDKAKKADAGSEKERQDAEKTAARATSLDSESVAGNPVTTAENFSQQTLGLSSVGVE